MKKASYQVALSFAGEDRPYVSAVADGLRRLGVSVFYDEYEKVSLWGKDLYTHLSDVYQNRSEFTVVFISEHYARKLWTNHERTNAQARAFKESREYILPVKFDDTEIQGIPNTVGYLDLRHTSPDELAELITQKIEEAGLKRARHQTFTSKELSARALEIAGVLREALARYQLRNNELIFDDAYRFAATEEEKSRAWNSRNEAMSRASAELMSLYGSQYKAEALLLRDEILMRIDIAGRDKHVDFMYEHPTNPLGLDEVLTDLEKLGLSVGGR